MNKPSFNDQLKQTKTLITNFGIIKAVDLTPPHPVGNPIVMSFGWCGTIEVSTPILRELYKHNRRVIAFNYPEKHVNTYLKNFPSYEEYKAEVLRHTVTYFSLDTFDLIAHSEGSYITLLAIKDFLNNVDNVIFINPSIMHKPLPAKELIQRVFTLFKANTRTLLNDNSYSNIYRVITKNIFKTFLKYPTLSLSSALTLLRLDGDRFRNIFKKVNKKIVILHSSNDALFPMPEVLQFAKKYGIKDVLEIEDNNAGHVGIALNPKLYVSKVIHLLDHQPLYR